MSGWLRAEVARSFAPPHGGTTERAIFGPLDAEALVTAIDRACATGFGVGLDDGFLYRVSRVIAHTDWSIRNVRFGPEGVVAAYDWDSLAMVPESEAVGGAAVSWCKSGEGDDPTPSVEQIEGYIDAYEKARGNGFSASERRSIRAAALAAMAYTARCEHCVDPDEERWTTTRPRLREAATVLLG